jgi:thiol-disulfide isomerase/thioredoxin
MTLLKLISGLWLILFTISGCQQKRVKVYGTAPGITNAVIEISTSDTSWRENIKNGRFALNFLIRKDEFAQLKLLFDLKPKETKSYLMYLEDGTYEIKLDPNKLKSYPKIKSDSKIQKGVVAYYNLLGYRDKNNKTAQLDFVSGFPNSLLSAYFLSTHKNEVWEKPLFYKGLYDKLGEDLKQTEYGKQANEYIGKSLRNQLGAPMPKLFGVTLNGDSLNTSKLKGKLTLLAFWASWNYPSVKDIPMLKQFYKEYKLSGLEIVGIAIDKRETRWKKAISYHGLNWLHVSDFKGAYSKNFEQYSTNSLPYYVLIGPNLEIVEHGLPLESLPIYMRDYQKGTYRALSQSH